MPSYNLIVRLLLMTLCTNNDPCSQGECCEDYSSSSRYQLCRTTPFTFYTGDGTLDKNTLCTTDSQCATNCCFDIIRLLYRNALYTQLQGRFFCLLKFLLKYLLRFFRRYSHQFCARWSCCDILKHFLRNQES